jgi:putative ABC transport system substrate-binding protein
MERRAFLGVMAGSLLAAPLAAAAQPAQKVWHIGWLDHLGAALEWQAPFVRELRELGYIEGRNLVLDVRHGEWEFDRLPALAADLVRRKVDLIVALRDPAIQAAMHATHTIPIAMVGSADPMGLGFVASLGRPAGNVTGLSDVGAELAGKQLDLLKQAVPRIARVTILTSATVGAKERAQRRTRQAAQALGITLRFEEIRNRADVEHAFADMAERPDALMVLGEQLLDPSSTIRIVQLAQTRKIPVMLDSVYETFHYGGLMFYGVSYALQAKRAATYVDKILKGAKPGDLPVEQPTKFDFVINLKTATALGLTIPPSLLQRADQVIE